MWWCDPIIVVVGSWWQVEGGLHLHRGPAWPWSGAVWPAGPQSQSKHATGLNVAEEGEDYHGCEGFLLDHPCAGLPPAGLLREHHGLSQK